MKTAIIVHGGAGAWQSDIERLQQAMTVCIEAALVGQAVLTQAGTAVDAVEAAVRVLEASPVLNAGHGSYPNANGNIEMDALIMDGKDLNLGAVAAVQRIRSPISLARRVMEDCDDALLVGPGTNAFADNIGFPCCELSDLLVDMEPPPTKQSNTLGDTVGAVAIDSFGNVAAATSTGGTINKVPGRVGDSPLVGCGGYADNHTAAVSATGRGEDLMKVVISKQVCDFVGSGLSANSACEAAIVLLEERVSGSGGVIAIDARGQIGFAYNTFAMPHAYAIGEEDINSGR